MLFSYRTHNDESEKEISYNEYTGNIKDNGNRYGKYDKQTTNPSELKCQPIIYWFEMNDEETLTP